MLTDERVRDEIFTARDIFSSTKTINLLSEENYWKGLGHIYLHCSEKMAPIVLATIQEAMRRKILWESARGKVDVQ